MLKIQRASAGSGKTYTLAKTYILNLIAYPTGEDASGNKTWKLRNERQIEDGLKSILAITFTNKATNEMKQRIVGNLAQMATAKDMTLQEVKDKRIPYLLEFSKVIGADYKLIAATAETALKTLLNNFTYFKISTIDSFFQEILRTFAYEANINERYQVELDANLIADTAMEIAISELDTQPKNMGEAAFWLKELMHTKARTANTWNPFNKSEASVYGDIKDAILQLEKEDFKEIKDALYEYFKDPKHKALLIDTYIDLQQKALDERKNLLKDLKSKIGMIKHIIATQGYKNINENFRKSLEKVLKYNIYTKDNNPPKYEGFEMSGTVFTAKFTGDGTDLNKEAMDYIALFKEWQNPPADSYTKLWQVYGVMMPYLGLILEIKEYITNVLETNNLIKLSDTGYILSKIVGDDDAPFIYERLGNRIDSYLIDEFQDTSNLQWNVIKPLIKESLAKEKDNLIIGDPKQSIYRFRNADHKLITETVPATFRPHEEAGFTEEENTNWRSHENIVKFNNYVFRVLASMLNELSVKVGEGYDYTDLYSNVVQKSHHNEGKGYVSLRFMPSAKYASHVLPQIGPLVSSLLRRGYHQKDIGILVDKNDQGKEVISSLIEYNASGVGEVKIDFISEESLLVGSSPAVQIVIGILGRLANPGYALRKDVEVSERNNAKYYNWHKLKIEYQMYAAKHPELTHEQKILGFLDAEEFEDGLSELVAALPTPSVSSIVEMVIKTFVESPQREQEALYLSSLQDYVSEFEKNHHGGVYTFLEAWNLVKDKLSVSSPEGFEAVQVMTIHKSKGLEFKCVILPFANSKFSPEISKDEWRWVETGEKEGMEFPPVLPIKAGSNLMGSWHEDQYRKFRDQVITDVLNKYYVAFTRARNELYIFTQEPTKSGEGESLYDKLYRILTYSVTQEGVFKSGDYDKIIDISDLKKEEPQAEITYGSPFSPEEIEAEYKKDSEKEGPKRSTHYMEGYFINDSRPQLKSTVSKVLPSEM